MDTKLTIKLNGSVIERAKEYALEKHTSVSKLVETYLDYLTSAKTNNGEITPLVKSLSGIIDLPKGYEHKKEYKKYISGKY